MILLNWREWEELMDDENRSRKLYVYWYVKLYKRSSLYTSVCYRLLEVQVK